MRQVKKAIIPVAGWGTRRLPITKTVEKCMLPIGNRPLIDYVVQDCIKAGIEEIFFVVSEQSTQIREYYASNEPLNEYLRTHGKEEKLALIAPLEGVTLHFITQPSNQKYGSAVPVELAAEYIEEGESAVVLMGDDFIWNEDGSSEVARLIEQTPEGECGLLAAEMELKPGGTLGLISKSTDDYYEKIVDQPLVEDNPPSNLANISKYLLTKDVIDMTRTITPAHNGEYQLPDAINQHVANGGRVKVVAAKGQYLDGGSLEGWLHANNVVIGSRSLEN